MRRTAHRDRSLSVLRQSLPKHPQCDTCKNATNVWGTHDHLVHTLRAQRGSHDVPDSLDDAQVGTQHEIGGDYTADQALWDGRVAVAQGHSLDGVAITGSQSMHAMPQKKTQ